MLPWLAFPLLFIAFCRLSLYSRVVFMCCLFVCLLFGSVCLPSVVIFSTVCLSSLVYIYFPFTSFIYFSLFSCAFCRPSSHVCSGANHESTNFSQKPRLNSGECFAFLHTRVSLRSDGFAYSAHWLVYKYNKNNNENLYSYLKFEFYITLFDFNKVKLYTDVMSTIVTTAFKIT